MIDMLNALDPMHRMFWYVALASSLFFLIQTVMTFVGADASDGTLADVDGSEGADAPFQLFSLRNMVNFLLGFSWTGAAMYHSVENKILLLVLAIAVGALLVAMFFIIIRQILKLAEDNSFRISECVGQQATVYLRIPARRSGSGKVQVSVRGAVHEMEALTAGDEIPTGSHVLIISAEGPSTLLVKTH